MYTLIIKIKTFLSNRKFVFLVTETYCDVFRFRDINIWYPGRGREGRGFTKITKTKGEV